MFNTSFADQPTQIVGQTPTVTSRPNVAMETSTSSLYNRTQNIFQTITEEESTSLFKSDLRNETLTTTSLLTNDTMMWGISTDTSLNSSNFSQILELTEEPIYVDDEGGLTLTQQVWVGIALYTGCFIIITGNILTIAIFITNANIRSVQNIYILNLAITDLLIGMSSTPIYALFTIINFDWIFGYTYCKIWSLTDYWVCAESSLTIILISYDRLQMVTQGAQYNVSQTKLKAVMKIIATWTVSFIIYGPAIIGYNHWRGHSTVEEGDCDVEFAEEFVYTVFTAFMEFCIPFVLLITFSVLLYWNIRKRTLSLMNAKAIQVSTITTTSQRDIAEKKNLRKDKKAAKSLAILVIAYAACWSPYTILTIVNSLCDGCVYDSIYEPATWLLWLNSGLNPLLYAVTNEKFRKNYSRLLCLHRCRKTFHFNMMRDKVHPMKSSGQSEETPVSMQPTSTSSKY